ncbi:peroxiredoxin family protein [Hyunsoonleella sp. 2307UL5-6]|uniref:peroxiredoxin family protein n=1 Tax=Hyunsoonleella sp. 2307UL5-6 TaxID=3384768 RepID=UPI0039BCCE50
MKKSFKFLVFIAVFVLFGYLGYGVISKIQHKDNVEKTLQSIQEFSFKTLNGQDFTKSNLKPNTPTVFIYFNTECDYCQHEAKSISKTIAQFGNTQLLFVSTEAAETIKTFAEHYNLLNKPNITFLNDTAYTFSNRFDATSIPYVLIYDGNQNLIKKHKGQLKAEIILQLLN